MTTDTPRYLIRVTRHYYAGTIAPPRVTYAGRLSAVHGYGYDVPLLPYDSLAAARDAVAELDAQQYQLGSGEHSRPTYRVVPLARCPEYVRNRAAAADALMRTGGAA